MKNQIPEKLKSYFWDTDPDKLDIVQNKDFIISRLYTKGGIEGINWINDHYSVSDIVCAARKRRDLNPIVANFLSKKYHIDRNEMKYYQIGQLIWR